MTGKAKHPANKERPVSASVQKALDNDNVEELLKLLTARQKRFAEEYVIDFNGTGAAIRAGYSKHTATEQAHHLNRHAGVVKYIDHLTKSKTAKIMSIDPDYVLARVTEIIQKDEAKDGDRLRGLELLARHLGMFVDKTEITGKDGGAIEVEQRRIEEESQGFAFALKNLIKKNEEK